MGHAQSCGVLGGFLCHVRGEIGAIGGTASLYLGSFFFRETRDFFGRRFRRSVGLLFGILFLFFFFEDGPTDKSVGFRFGCGFLVFGLDEIGGQRVDLILVEIGIAVYGFGFVCRGHLRRFAFFGVSGGRRFRFRGSICKEPAWQATRKAARNTSTARNGIREGALRDRWRFIGGGRRCG